jgi:hypothetical protein
MNAKKMLMLIIATLGLLAAGALRAQPADAGFYGPSELSGDLYGFTASRDRGGADQQAWGPGVGVNYFITRNLGIGADSYADAFKLPYQANASAIFRYPLGDSGLAPYGFAGAGRQWDNRAQWLGHLGIGLEYRFSERTGVFADVREVFPEKTADSIVFRVGFRIKLL